MAVPTLRTYAPDMVVPLDIGPGGLDRLMDLIGERSNPRVKYHNGRVLLVSPGESHERTAHRIDMVLMAICTTLRIAFRGYMSTLYRRPGFDHGVEPDLSYYVQNVRAVRGMRREIDLSTDPPPDLAVEVVVTHGAALSMKVCQELGVPELWVYEVPAGRMTFWQRRRTGPRAGKYAARERSLAFPFLRAADLPPWLEDTDAADSSEFLRMQRWARDALGPRRKPGGA
jgi:Uma2 family endonuclease